MALFSFDRSKEHGNGDGNGDAAAVSPALAPPPLPTAPQTGGITPERQAYLMQMRVKIHQKLV